MNAMQIDLNCDMGEGIGNEAGIMPFISSANIACGFHAGNGETISHTMDLAVQYGVHVGAHPSFRDRENFGRKEMHLPAEKLYAVIIEQLIKMDLIAKEKGIALHHVKPHGALYNMAARNRQMARVMVQAVSDFTGGIILYGLSGSVLIEEAKIMGLPTLSEVFADRTYQDDGSLLPRTQSGAVITDENEMLAQVLQMINQSSVTSFSGKVIPIVAETICIHGDGPHATAFARKIHEALRPVAPSAN